MLTLEQTNYWKIGISKIEELLFEQFKIRLNLSESLDINQGYFTVDEILKESDQILDKETVNDCLVNNDRNAEKLINCVWLLVIKNILPEGNYLVCVNW